MGKSGRNRRTPLFFGITYRLVLIIAAGALFLSYLSSYIDPTISSIPLFFGLYYIPILCINIILLIIAIVWRSKSAWISIIAILPSLLYAERFYKISNNSNDNYIGIKTSIISYNVGTFASAKNHSTREKTMAEIEKQILKSNPDIILLQEAFFKDKEQIDKLFREYPYRSHHLFNLKNGRKFGNITFSKHKILESKSITFKGSTNLSLYTDILLYRDTVRVFNNHLESYNISFSSLAKKIFGKNNDAEETTNEIIKLHSKMKNTLIKRSKQVSLIQKSVQQSKFSTIVCGDHNETPMSYVYHQFSKNHKDTFKESGNNFSATYSYLWPLLRIDYIFIPYNYHPISHQTPKWKLSDHYPVIAEFAIQK